MEAKALYEQATREGALTEETRANVFARLLQEQLRNWPQVKRFEQVQYLS